MTSVQTEMQMPGRPTQGKPINLLQLQSEIEAAGVVATGLGMCGMMDGSACVHIYDADGQPIDFASADQPTVDAAIAAHVAMRDKTDAELSAEFRAPGTTPARKQDIRDMQSGLLEREQVPM